LTDASSTTRTEMPLHHCQSITCPGGPSPIKNLG
jgi:hypothetical protein